MLAFKLSLTIAKSSLKGHRTRLECIEGRQGLLVHETSLFLMASEVKMDRMAAPEVKMDSMGAPETKIGPLIDRIALNL